MSTIEAILSRTWGKEDELKALKSELAVLDRKITAALAAKNEEQDGEENKQQPDTQRVEVRDNQSQATGPKETMVAEPCSYICLTSCFLRITIEKLNRQQMK